MTAREAVLELRLTRSDPAPGHGLVPGVPEDAQVWRDREGVRRAFGFTHEGEHWIHLPGVSASFRFGNEGDVVEAIADEETPTELVEDAYRRRVLPFALQALGRELLHASAVELPRGSVAFCGGSGAGKSTLAHAFAERGRRPLADDALLFEAVNGDVLVHPLPFSMRIVAPSWNGAAPGHKETLVVDTEDHPPAPLAGVFVLERTPDLPGSAPEIERLPRHEAFSLLLYHAHCFSFSDEERRRRMFERYLELTARVPAFTLRYRPAKEEIPALLDRVEAALE